MKKIILAMILMLISACSASASPVMPMPVKFFFTHNGAPAVNFKVIVTIGDTSFEKYTNEFGGFQITLNNYDLSSDSLKLDCGFNVCNKAYVISSLNTPYTETFVLADSPPSCPSCNCGGGSSCTYSKTKCESLYDFNCPVCPSSPNCQPCLSQPDCPETICPEPSCPNCQICEENICEVCPSPSNDNLKDIIIGIILAIGGLFGGVGIKIYKDNAGNNKILHKHSGIIGYHDHNILHSKLNIRHKKGELNPEYTKDANGVWQYQA